MFADRRLVPGGPGWAASVAFAGWPKVLHTSCPVLVDHEPKCSSDPAGYPVDAVRFADRVETLFPVLNRACAPLSSRAAAGFGSKEVVENPEPMSPLCVLEISPADSARLPKVVPLRWRGDSCHLGRRTFASRVSNSLFASLGSLEFVLSSAARSAMGARCENLGMPHAGVCSTVPTSVVTTQDDLPSGDLSNALLA